MRAAPGKSQAEGKQLVIVESPAKAKTINKYLGEDFVVRASVGHIRDLPSRAPRGTKQPVPGVDLENDFRPTYEILSEKTKTVAELKRDAKAASDIWFATDLDREGEAIAWHLAEILDVEASVAKRVVFNAITKEEIKRAFSKPRAIDVDRVNAQQARRILDRIVGYQASPLLWKKVARGLSAGRVQSVAVRLVVEREREIEAHVPDETWKIDVRLASEVDAAPGLAGAWDEFIAQVDDKGRGPNKRRQNAWLAEHGSVLTELYEYKGARLKLGCSADEPLDLTNRVIAVAEAVGMRNVEVDSVEDPEGKGPARFVRSVRGELDFSTRYTVRKIETRQTSSKPSAPFITSTLQMAASSSLGFSAQRTMRLAQDLYEGVELAGEGQVALITYMRTDSTHLSPEAINSVREFIDGRYGKAYLPEKARKFSSTNKDAQEAHEAIRPTDVKLDPELIRAKIKGPRAEEQYKLYKLIWSRFVGCQMNPARWASTSVHLHRSDVETGAVLRASGRVLAFDGFYRATGVPTASDEQTLPKLAEGDTYAPFQVTPKQKFSSPPPRYSEASLVKALESEGIGRPSTYASIIQLVQSRNYVEQRDRRFYASDLGEVVTDKLIEAFPDLMDVGYTRQMERELDEIEGQNVDWVAMLRRFYTAFSSALEVAHEGMAHAKAEIQPALYKCPKCGARTCYRFGRNGRFLSCTAYPECDYAAPIDRKGRPLLPERVDIVSPEDGSSMELRNGRFGKFLASENYEKGSFVLNLDRKGNIKYPAIPPLVIDVEEGIQCVKCDAPLNLRRGARGPWLGCSRFPKCRGRLAWKTLDEELRADLEARLEVHEAANPRPEIKRHDGSIIPEGTPVESLLLPGGVAELEIHPEAEAELAQRMEAPLPPPPRVSA
ncbi:DNA topoisomerase [Plesiocystis pacifica SIR-1]|uniref:DNA topoisomerase 1 n=1 Tax=Plesiocystis pacifica SIR-1 TaxID=391625 RepID=A6G953_9BACT|nr:topoisomerase DNA-binding C4 zinc finger domain-containing protein [Plesiocystis pacifica]EDM77601.1 DNA topoisomerase [Plesiocystis pacifica SIR-1]